MNASAFGTLISASELMGLQATAAQVVVLDCGFDLTDPKAGKSAWIHGHLPTALYASLDHDLAGEKNGRNGRHPLPDRAALAAWLGQCGIAPGVQVVTYDAQGSPYAARAWWLLRWMGHSAVAVLDGGRAAWLAAGGKLTADSAAPSAAAPYPAAAPSMPTMGATALEALLGQVLLLDARAGERFRGETEPLDPVAGHIPGATNRFFKDNLQADGRFKNAADLRREFVALGVADSAADRASNSAVVQQCGSGVTACHNLLAMCHAGLGDSTLYPGSWSEWCSDPRRPAAKD
jgi:thiosulfate/3-mercaptopyruvate sulfurtransferase